MIIVSQDKKMIFNYENIEAIGIGDPLENNNGKFAILIETISDNQYPIAEYEKEERAAEVLKEIIKKVNSQKFLLKPKVKVDQETTEAAKAYFERINGIDLIIDDASFEILPIGNSAIPIYEMPEK